MPGTRYASFLLLALSGAACHAERSAITPAATTASPTASASVGSSATPPAGTTTAPGEPSSGERWFEDRPAAALEHARAERKLVLADLWAPWCHTCLSMQEQVLHSRVVPELGQLVLLSVDTEREENEQFLRSYPVGVWPTFYVIDASSGVVRGRWLGAATPEQLSQWLKQAAAPSPDSAAVREGDALAAKKDWAGAAARYRAALPGSGSRRAEVLVPLASALAKHRNYRECVELGAAELRTLAPSISAVDFTSTSLSCADKLTGEEQPKRELRRAAVVLLERACSAPAPGASPDDQADACGNLRGARQALGDSAGARRASEQALSVIEAASRGASPEAQLIYDWERTSSLVHLGRAPEAIALLQQRERDLPASYNPPHYQARIYRDLKDYPAGLAAIERALELAYGPRRIGFLTIKAELLKGAARLTEACATLTQQLSDYRALPPGQQQPDAILAAEKRQADWCGGVKAP